MMTRMPFSNYKCNSNAQQLTIHPPPAVVKSQYANKPVEFSNG